MIASGQNPTPKAWENESKQLRNGLIWHKSLLNSDKNLKLDHRVVDFYDVFTLPVTFLEQWLKRKNKDRPRLRPPYREHLSQAFARFYMRVGLPTPIEKFW
jgi:hypothetical protein